MPPPPPQPEPEDRPLRWFDLEVRRGGMIYPHEIRAHYLAFSEGFTQFWQNKPANVPDFLVLAVRSDDVVILEESADDAPVLAAPVPVAEPAGKVVRRPLETGADLLDLDDLDG